MRQFFHPELGFHVGPGMAFSLEGVNYPGNWTEHATDAEISDIGLTPVQVIGERGDDRYYDNAEVLEGRTLTITKTKKDDSIFRAAQWIAIKAKRDAIKVGGIKVSGHWFHTDDATRIQFSVLDASATRGALPGEAVLHPSWKTMGGERSPMTVSLLRQIIDAIIARDFAIFEVAEGHKVAMGGCSDPASYDFSGGWPDVFGVEK